MKKIGVLFLLAGLAALGFGESTASLRSVQTGSFST